MGTEFYKIQCICIEDDLSTQFPIKKGYMFTCEGHPDSPLYYSVSSANNGNKYHGVHEQKYFISLADWREEQINNILND